MAPKAKAAIAKATPEPKAAAAKAKATPKAMTAASLVFPPEESTRGKRYYVHHLAHQTAGNGPFVAVGQHVALHFLGGTWIGGGQAPKGFANLEDACNDLLTKTNHPGLRLRGEDPISELRLVWSIPEQPEPETEIGEPEAS